MEIFTVQRIVFVGWWCYVGLSTIYAFYTFNNVQYKARCQQHCLHGRGLLRVAMMVEDTQKEIPRNYFYSQKDLQKVGLNAKMIDVLSSMGIVRPSKIQSLAFPFVYNKKTCIVGKYVPLRFYLFG